VKRVRLPQSQRPGAVIQAGASGVMLVQMASYLPEPYCKIFILLAPIFATTSLWFVPAAKRKLLQWSYGRAIKQWAARLKGPHELSDAAVDKISEILENAVIEQAREALALPPEVKDDGLNDVSNQESRRSARNTSTPSVAERSIASKSSKRLPKARATLTKARPARRSRAEPAGDPEL